MIFRRGNKVKTEAGTLVRDPLHRRSKDQPKKADSRVLGIPRASGTAHCSSETNKIPSQAV